MIELQATFYHRPHGEKTIGIIRDIKQEDAKWFIDHKVKVSMESGVNGNHIIYADIGETLEDGTPVDIIVMSDGRDCNTVMTEVRNLCESKLNEQQKKGNVHTPPIQFIKTTKKYLES